MKLKDLYNVINPYVNFQVGDFNTKEPIGFCGNLIGYIDEEYKKYEDYWIVEIKVAIDNHGEPYLKVYIDCGDNGFEK